LQKRIAALKGATIGVAAIGGTQEKPRRVGLRPKAAWTQRLTSRLPQVGSPPALQAALENKRIDAFVLSPPEGYLAAKSGAGTILISLGDEFPLLANQPYLVLVAKKPIDDKISELIVRVLRAMQAASAALVKDPSRTRWRFRSSFSPRPIPMPSMAAIKSLNSGVASGGKLDVEAFRTSWCFSNEVGTNFGKEFDAAASQNDLWTNSFVERAAKNNRAGRDGVTDQPVGVNRAIKL